jgi:hypothetical protein
MVPIDIFDYVLSQKKIPDSLLTPHQQKNGLPATKLIFFSYLIDFTTALTTTFMFSGILKLSLGNFIISEKLFESMMNTESYSSIFFALPVVLTSYFFFCFFLNHGQSWGLKVIRARISMPAHDFRLSIRWALYSTFSILTLGTGVFMLQRYIKNKGPDGYVNHDELYLKLILPKDYSPLSLVEISEKNSSHRDESFEEHRNAA